jgi:hypothetical protein
MDVRSSGALVLTALIIGAFVVGTAIAGSGATTSAVSPKKVKRIARTQVKKLAPGLSVSHATTAGQADAATNATQAANAATADAAATALQADNSNAVNGIRLVKVDFAVPAGTPQTDFLDQGGVRVSGLCFPSGDTRFDVTSTADNGVLRFETASNGPTSPIPILDFDTGLSAGLTANAAFPSWLVLFNFRGADGTQVRGELQVARGSGVAQCLVAGTLFVS